MNKFIASCIQRRFSAADWQEAEKVLALYCGESLPFPHEDLLRFMNGREIRRWRSRVQLHVVNMSEGNLNRLRQYAALEAHYARTAPDSMWLPYIEWMDKSGKLRGIETTDYNNSLTFVRADLDTVGQTFQAQSGIWARNVLEQDVRIDRPFFLMFQFPGNAWTQLLGGDYVGEILGIDWRRVLSERLDTRVIRYVRSDTVSFLAYSLYESGTLLEELSTESENWQYCDAFTSHRSDVTMADLSDLSRFDLNDQLFIEEETYEPGIELGDLLRSPESTPDPLRMHRSWKQVHLPDWEEGTRGDKGRSLLQRIDYVGFDTAA